MNRIRVLVADDEMTSQLCLAALDPAQYEVRVLLPRVSFIESALHVRPDVVLLNYDLPGDGGLGLAGELLREPQLQQTRVIFLTERMCREEAVARSIFLGRAIFRKPVDWDLLALTLRSLTGRRFAEKSAA